MRDEKVHPMKQILDNIWNAGHTPKLLIDATHDDVVFPDYVKDRWGNKMPIDLDAQNPLNIVFDEVGIHADLAFDGHVARCTMPWKRIYAVIDRDTGKGLFISEHAPSEQTTGIPIASVGGKAALIPSTKDEPVVERKGLRLVKGGKA